MYNFVLVLIFSYFFLMAIVVINFETCERCFGLIFFFRMVVLTSFSLSFPTINPSEWI
jgi:hypothetical protein